MTAGYGRSLVLGRKLIRSTNGDLAVNRILKTGVLSFVIAVIFAGVAIAKSSGPSTKAVKITIKGTGGGSAPGGNVSPDGQCFNTGDPWLDNYTGTCSTPGNCSCSVLSSPKVSGGKLKTVTNFFVTGDDGINPATESAVGNGPQPQCSPFLGIFTVTETGSDLTTVNFFGVSCKHVTGISKNNPSGTHDKDLMSGGWGVSGNPTPTIPTSGWGTFTGTTIKATNAVSISLSGWVTQ
jgi:hypothetical protein